MGKLVDCFVIGKLTMISNGRVAFGTIHTHTNRDTRVYTPAFNYNSSLYEVFVLGGNKKIYRLGARFLAEVNILESDVR